MLAFAKVNNDISWYGASAIVKIDIVSRDPLLALRAYGIMIIRRKCNRARETWKIRVRTGIPEEDKGELKLRFRTLRQDKKDR